MAITNATLAQQVADLISHWDGFNEEYKNWLGGSISGGPSMDGRYPLTDYSGNIELVDSPAKLADSVNNNVTGAVAARTAAEAAQAAAESASTTAVSARDLALSYRDSALSYRDAALAAQVAAESARATAIAQASVATANAAQTTLDAAATAADAVSTAADAASAAASAAAAATFDPALFVPRAGGVTITGALTMDQIVYFQRSDGLGARLANNTRLLALNQAGTINVNGMYLSTTDRWKFSQSGYPVDVNDTLTVTGLGTFNAGVTIPSGGLNIAGQTLSSGDIVDFKSRPWMSFGSGAAREGSPYFDIDTQTTDGMYRMHSAANHNNTPGSLGYGNLMVVDNSDVHTQVYFSREQNGRMHTRTLAGSLTGISWNDVAFSNLAESISTRWDFLDGIDITGDLIHNDTYLDVRKGSAGGAQGIRFLDSNSNIEGYVYSDGAGTFGLLHSSGGWAVQIAPASTTVTFPGNVNVNSGLDVTGTLNQNGSVLISSGYLQLPVGEYVVTDAIRARNAQQLVLNAGESYVQASGQTGESVYVNAENGMQLNSSPDNWATGWAGRHTAHILDANGKSRFPAGDFEIADVFEMGDRAVGNATGRGILMEKVNSAAGEGSGRLFFSENNTTSPDLYGMSLFYSGDTAPTLPSGFAPGTGNATWGIMRHDNSLNGALVMSGSRTNSNVNFHAHIDIEGLEAFRKASNWLYINGAGQFTTGVYVGSYLEVLGPIRTSDGTYRGSGGQEMMRGNDSWVRLNQNQSFASGVYTPGNLRVDGAMYVSGSGYIQDEDGRRVRSMNQTSSGGSSDEGFSYVDYVLGTASATPGWHTIATNPAGLDITAAPLTSGGSRASARFIVQDRSSGRHETYFITAICHYGQRPYLKVEGSHYGTAVLNKFRIVEQSTYAGAALQVNTTVGSLNIYVHMLENIQNTGWVLRAPAAQTPHASWSTTCEVDSSGWGVNYNGRQIGLDQNGDFKITNTSGTEAKFAYNDVSDYGGLLVDAVKAGWNGISIGGKATWMALDSGTRFGMYDDQDNHWVWQYGNVANRLDLYFDNNVKLSTDAAGINVTGGILLNGGGTNITELAGGDIRVQNEHGYIDLGPKNTSHAHIYTDRPSFYFNQDIYLDSGHRLVGNDYTRVGSPTKPQHFEEQNVVVIPDGNRGTDQIHFYPWPKGGTLNSNNANETGYCRILFNSTNSLSDSVMGTVEIHGYNYSPNSKSDSDGGPWGIVVGGYWYSSENWNYCNVHVLYGNPPFDRVRLGEATAGKYILLGESTTNWNYPQIMLRGMMRGYSTQEMGNEDFTVTISTALPTGWTAEAATDGDFYVGGQVRWDQTAGFNLGGKMTVSTSAPSGGANGDIHFEY